MEYHFISHYITIIDALTVFLLENELWKEKRRHIKTESRNNHPAAADISFFLYSKISGT